MTTYEPPSSGCVDEGTDTSVAVPALPAWHDVHDAVVAHLAADDRLPDHVALQIYAVLTRLPAPLQLSPAAAADVLRRRFPPPYLHLPEKRRDDLPTAFASVGVRGGATYDGLVGLTATANDCLLLTRDMRAMATYHRLDVAVEWLPDETRETCGGFSRPLPRLAPRAA